MKKIIDYIVKNWIILLLIAVGVFLMVSGGIGSCKQKKAEQIVTEVNVSTMRQQLTDSILAVQAKKDITLIDSLNTVNDKKLSETRKENKTNEAKLNAKIQAYQSDTTSQTPACDSVISQARIVIDNLKEEVRLVSDINKNLNLKIEIGESELTRTSQSLSLAYASNEKLQKVIYSQNTWWRRNEKYVYYGAGVATAIAIIKAASAVMK